MYFVDGVLGVLGFVCKVWYVVVIMIFFLLISGVKLDNLKKVLIR